MPNTDLFQERMLGTCLEVGADEPIAFSILSFWKCSWESERLEYIRRKEFIIRFKLS